MNLFSRFIFVIVLMIWCQPASTIEPITVTAAAFSIVSATIAITVNMKSVIQGSYRFFGKQKDRETREYYLSAEQNAIIDQFIDLSRQNNEHFLTLKDLIGQAIVGPEVSNFITLLGKFFENAIAVDSYYTEVARYMDQFPKYPPDFLANKTSGMLYKYDIPQYIRNVRSALTDTRYYSVLELFLNSGKDFLHKTNTLQSPQQFLSQLLQYYIKTEQKSYLSVSYCYDILERLGGTKGKLKTPIADLRKEFAENINKTVAKFKNHITLATLQVSTEFFRPNPPVHVRGKTYTEMERLFQSYVIRQDNLDTSGSIFGLRWLPCKGECSDYRVVKDVTRCDTDECSLSRCNGTLYDCEFVIDTDAKICVSRKNSIRKYDYITYGNNRRYGPADLECPKDRLVKAEGGRKVNSCNQCTCTCADKSELSDRFICAKWQTTNTSANYVLTGVRLKKVNHTIYLENQEGLLLPNGSIQEDSLRWITGNYECGDDLWELDWRYGRQIMLGNIKVPTRKQVLTGMSFAVRDLNIIVRGQASYFNFSTGQVEEEDIRTELSVPSYESYELRLYDRDTPVRPGRTRYGLEKTDEHRFVRLQPSGMDSDVGQSTIPFFDIQEVAPYPPMPLGGFGIHHKAANADDGGFIGLSVFTYDIGHLLSADLPADFDATNFYNTMENYLLKKRL